MGFRVGKDGRLFDVDVPGSQLVVRTRSSAYRSQVRVLTLLAAAVVVLIVAYLVAARIHSGMWLLVGLLAVILLALAAKATDVRSAGRDSVFVIDRDEDQIVRDGEVLASVSNVDRVLIREVLDADRPTGEYALVVSLDDTRRVTVGEAVGLNDGLAQVEAAAEEIARFAGVPVEHATRQADEWWMDK